jgi:hypothetical protein
MEEKKICETCGKKLKDVFYVRFIGTKKKFYCPNHYAELPK